MRVERLPFTVYDVVGYFIPGFMLLIGVTHFIPAIEAAIDTHKKLLGDSFSGHAVEIAFVIVLSYALGHIVSLMADKTVELAVVKIIGYPSEYLLHESWPGSSGQVSALDKWSLCRLLS